MSSPAEIAPSMDRPMKRALGSFALYFRLAARTKITAASVHGDSLDSTTAHRTLLPGASMGNQEIFRQALGFRAARDRACQHRAHRAEQARARALVERLERRLRMNARLK